MPQHELFTSTKQKKLQRVCGQFGLAETRTCLSTGQPLAVVQEEDRLAAAEAGTARDKREIRNALSLSLGPGQDAQGMVC